MEQRPQYVTRDAYDGRNNLVDERCEREEKRLDGQEQAIRQMLTLSAQMGEILKKYDEQLSVHEKRLWNLECQPADTLGKVKAAIIAALISGIAGYFFNSIVQNVRP